MWRSLQSDLLAIILSCWSAAQGALANWLFALQVAINLPYLKTGRGQSGIQAHCKWTHTAALLVFHRKETSSTGLHLLLRLLTSLITKKKQHHNCRVSPNRLGWHLQWVPAVTDSWQLTMLCISFTTKGLIPIEPVVFSFARDKTSALGLGSVQCFGVLTDCCVKAISLVAKHDILISWGMSNAARPLTTVQKKCDSSDRIDSLTQSALFHRVLQVEIALCITLVNSSSVQISATDSFSVWLDLTMYYSKVSCVTSLQIKLTLPLPEQCVMHTSFTDKS